MVDAVHPETVAIMIEPIQGEGGIVVPPAGYLRGLRALADRRDLLLIFDEVQMRPRPYGPALRATSTRASRPTS